MGSWEENVLAGVYDSPMINYDDSYLYDFDEDDEEDDEYD